MSAPQLHSIRDFKQLVRYLEDELGWPLDGYAMEDITFEYEPSELGLDAKSAVRIKEIKQLRPLTGSQPWGIFFVNFEKKNLPVVVMRKLLRALVFKKRASANKSDQQAWQAHDLLFISAYGEETDRSITFAHFVENPGNDLAELRVLGWDDDDTPLHMDYVSGMLKKKLQWDDKLTTDPEVWRKQWSEAFVLRHRFVITKSDELAAALAALARNIRNRICTILKSEDGFGEMRKLQNAFRTGLIHDLDDDGFADMFAQTVTYGLFSLACRRTVPGEGTAFVKDDLQHYFTSPFLKEMLGVFLGLKSRKGSIDFDELGVSDVTDLLTSPDTHMDVVLADFNNKTRGEDPVIHFYEHFLAAYNKKLKIQRGVFYTPQPVVGYIVRSVHELLQTEFGLEHGLADTTTWGEMISRSVGVSPTSSLKLPPLTDEPGETRTISPDEPFVQILDPATGTATFLVEVIDVIHKHLKERWRLADSEKLPGGSSHFKSFPNYWNYYVPNHLLPRLHAYELMMAPYAIAHMKIGLKLAETGYRFATEERARIYLTNALEPWQKQLPLIGFDALAHEAAAVNEVKRHKRFTVVIGNPPYSGLSSNMSESALRIVDAYRIIDGEALNERKLWIQDDYVKFFRKTQTIIESAGYGVVGLITNHGYLNNPTFRGMRQSLLTTFPQLYLLDLHGNSGKKEKSPDGSDDKNVFDIKQGVAVCLAARVDGKVVRKHEDLWGERDVKYNFLDHSTVGGGSFASLSPESPYYVFGTQDSDIRDEYKNWLSLWDCFGTYGTGVVTARDALTTNLTKDQLLENLREFVALNEENARERFDLGKDARDWKVTSAQADLRANPPSEDKCVRIQYRPFDVRWTHFTGNSRGIYASPCRSTMSLMLNGDNLGLISARSNASSANDHFFVTRFISEAKCGESSRQSALFPLFLIKNNNSKTGELAFGDSKSSNLSREITLALSKELKSSSLTPEDIFHFIYAVFHSPGYRSRYAEFLKIDFPRLPLTGNLELFRALSQLGGELVALHLLEFKEEEHSCSSKSTGNDRSVVAPHFIGSSKLVTKPGWTPDQCGTVWLDSGGKKAETTPGNSGFQGVPEAVWNFHIGGYQVCHKWLKDRKGRTLTAEDIAHYQKIVIALSETIRLMAEIDQVIDHHGGWPGAFASNDEETKSK